MAKKKKMVLHSVISEPVKTNFIFLNFRSQQQILRIYPVPWVHKMDKSKLNELQKK